MYLFVILLFEMPFWWTCFARPTLLFLKNNFVLNNHENSVDYCKPYKYFLPLLKILMTLNELKHVHLLMIEFEHPIFGFEWTNIEPNRVINRFTKLLIKLDNPNIIFSNIERTQTCSLFVIKLEHPIFGFKRSNI